MNGQPTSRLKASQLIAQLQNMVEKHGDLRVWLPAYEYPEPVSVVRHDVKGEPGYRPANVFVLK